MTLSGDMRAVLVVLCRSAHRRPTKPLALRRIAMSVLGDTERAAKVLAEMDIQGYVRTDIMGWHSGWVTVRGREAVKPSESNPT